MKHKVVIVDTSILIVWLQIPGFEEAGEERITYKQIDERLNQYKSEGAYLMLTIACVIESGNHIAQIKDSERRREKVNEFAAFLESVVNNSNGWMMYYSEKDLWSKEEMLKLISMWRENGIYKLSMGDTSILKVANQLKYIYNVEVFTGDRQLHELSLVPAKPVYAPSKKRN